MAERLPIRLFEKRDQDVLRTEAGGSSSLPKWVLSGEELRAKSAEIYTSLKSIEEIIKMKNTPDFVPTIVKVEIVEKAKAKSHKKEVSNFFKVNKNSGEIGLNGDKEVIMKIDSRNCLDSIVEKTLKFDKNKYPLSAIENVTEYEPIINIDEEHQNYKLKMFNYHSYETNRVVKEYLQKELRRRGLQVDEVKYSKDLTIFKVKNITVDTIPYLKTLPIHSINPMPKYTINKTEEIENFNTLIKLEFDNTLKYPVVGVLDSGIEINEYNRDWVVGREQYYIDEDLSTNHGTFVSGIILYGDRLENTVYTGINGCKVLDVPVISTDTDEDELISNIRRGISNNKDIKIWNLSVSVKQEIDDENFSDIAMAIDQIQDEFDVIICKSAGNCSSFQRGYPKGKIHTPGDSVRSIVVGSICQETDEVGFSRKDYPSPYTRIGRGPAKIIKPDLVHYGGDVWKEKNQEFVNKGVKSLSRIGQIDSDSGTSFSTPRVSAILAGLQNEINEDFDALTLKALLIHSANYGECYDMNPKDKLEQMGFGKPKNVQDILYSNENEITLVLRDTLGKGKYVDIMDFPYPKNLIQEGYFEGQITVTLVYNPILAPNQGSEYCQSNINVHFGTYEEKVNRDVEKRTILNPMGRGEHSKNLLNSNLYSRKVDYSSDTPFATERMLIDFGDKFYPVKKYSIDLSEMTPANKEKFIKVNRNWYLKVEGLYRDFIEKQALENDADLSMEYCAIVTIKDPNRQNDVYSDVVSLLNNNNFIHRDININIDVRVQNELDE
ncbi:MULTISPECIES: S8 family peptidase [Cytobacillus]|uniref:Peptidase S8/S53 domain-containing protein n=1 Tax=Cytobacillus oceanisediminis TaxID=665099 RepID=A0ABX3CK12_9BACI|nr:MULTISPECIES: S8 family peptidase [Cytobacillus]OHX41424.1 hypothetical protein BBV17_28945 [Cytobacillus oceanisediminis]